MYDERRPAAEDRVVTIQAADRVAGVAALLQAQHVGIAKIPASRALQEVPADGAEIANLRRRRLAGSLGNRGELRANRGMLGHFTQLHRRTEAKVARRPQLNSTELFQPFQIHQRGWRHDILLRQIDDVAAAGKRDVPIFSQQPRSARNIRRRYDFESIHRNSKSFTRAPAPPALYPASSGSNEPARPARRKIG